LVERIPVFYPFIPEEAIEAVGGVLRSRYVGQGPKVEEFEKSLGEAIGNPLVASVNSGTSALRLALAIIGVGPGDEVITPAQTSQATNMPILEQLAKPVFADVRYESCTLDPEDIAHRITKKTKAIICVDFGGYPSDLDEIKKVARESGVPLIEDAAHALGAEYHGKKVGGLCDFTVFSFQAVKHITTGDGGAIAVLDKKQFDEAVRRRWYGIDRASRKFSYLGIDPSFDITEVGFKYHMNDIAAAMGLVQLNHLDEVLARREEISSRYREELSPLHGIELFESKSDRRSSNWVFAVHCKNRLGFAKKMWENGVEVSVVNWRNDKYTVFGGLRKDLPNTDRIYRDYLALPLHCKLTDDQVDKVVRAVKLSCNRP
jgi:perosamine synthetase